MKLSKVEIDRTRLASELEKLATFSDCSAPPPAVTRIVFTESDLNARAYLESLMIEARLQVRVDPIGNLFARWQGSVRDAPAIGTGSHYDAIPHAGMYDGTVGVLGGLEAIRSLQRSGFRPKKSIELLAFTSEEPTRFGIGCSGSRSLTGSLTPEDLSRLVDSSETSYDEARLQAGFHGSLDDIRLKEGYYNAFVELHIEQGPELEAVGIPIGIVTAIAAPAQLTFTISGEGGHAGAVLMPGRRDALCGAAELVLVIEQLARASKSPDLVATVGELAVHPGAANSIPSCVELSLDLRDIDLTNRDQLLECIHLAAKNISAERGITITSTTTNADPPAHCDDRIISAIRGACRTLGHESQSMISRAYHDSLFMAQIAPIGMIFIPCRGGVSHRPDEYSSPEQIEQGTQVLALALAELAGSA